MSKENTSGRGLEKRDIIKCTVFIVIYLLFRLIPTDNDAFKLAKYIVLGTASIICFREVFIKGIKLFKQRPVYNTLWIAGAFVADMVLSVILSIPMGIICPDYESINNSNVFEAAQNYPAIVIILAMCVLGPIFEETIFRIIPVIKGCAVLPNVLMIIGSSVLFMAIHIHQLTLPELLYNLPIFGTGLVFAVAAHKTDNILISCIIHVCINLMGLIPVLLL